LIGLFLLGFLTKVSNSARWSNRGIVKVWIKLPDGQVVIAERLAANENFIIRGQTFRGRWSDFIKFLQVIADSFYVGPFRNAISEGSGSYYDIAIARRMTKDEVLATDIGAFLNQI
jgi:hypothetical protein